jgi:hypothetical protein
MNMKEKLANYISLIGHPFVTIPVFVIIALFNHEDFLKATWISALIIGGIFIPLTIKLYQGKKDGTYTNFDVSNQKQRQSVYVYAITLLGVVTLILFVTDQSRTLRVNMLFSFLLLLSSQVSNYFIKSSLHISFNLFLSFLLIPMLSEIAIIFFVCVFFIGWARIVLQRHTLKEVLAGGALGLIYGGGALLVAMQ